MTETAEMAYYRWAALAFRRRMASHTRFCWMPSYLCMLGDRRLWADAFAREAPVP